MDNKFFMQDLGQFTTPDEDFKNACAGYCQMAMERVGVSRDAASCILESLFETMEQISLEAAKSSWKNK